MRVPPPNPGDARLCIPGRRAPADLVTSWSSCSRGPKQWHYPEPAPHGGRRHVALFHEEIDERPYVVLSALAPLNRGSLRPARAERPDRKAAHRRCAGGLETGS
jgi:hypothetical protein